MFVWVYSQILTPYFIQRFWETNPIEFYAATQNNLFEEEVGYRIGTFYWVQKGNSPCVTQFNTQQGSRGYPMSLNDDAKLAFINLLLPPPIATKAVPAVNSAVVILTQKIQTRHWLFPMNYQSLFMQQSQQIRHTAQKGSNSNNWFRFPDFKLFADNGVSSGTLQYAKLCFLSFGRERLVREYTFRIKRGCPPGTYEDTSVTSSYVDHCKPCPTGRYSTGGKNQKAIH